MSAEPQRGGVLGRSTVEIVGVCDEGDSVWETADEVPAPATTTVEPYLSARGLLLLHSRLAALG